jgi:protein-arginine kinase activator protein McsA
MITGVTQQLRKHISEKISYHRKLMKQNEALENYEQCAVHRDEIKRLESMIQD